MRPAYYQEQWDTLKALPAPHPEQLKSLAQRIAATFVDRYFYSDEYNERYIRLICEMATHFDDPNLNQIAARTLFGVIVERLCDDKAIELAKDIAPQSTRARLRGDFIRRAKERKRDFTVDWVHLKLNDQAQRTVLCKDPFKSQDDRVDKLIASL